LAAGCSIDKQWMSGSIEMLAVPGRACDLRGGR
jgi:hypothetical protein